MQHFRTALSGSYPKSTRLDFPSGQHFLVSLFSPLIHYVASALRPSYYVPVTVNWTLHFYIMQVWLSSINYIVFFKQVLNLQSPYKIKLISASFLNTRYCRWCQWTSFLASQKTFNNPMSLKTKFSSLY